MAAEGEGDIDLLNDETFGDGAVGEGERERDNEREREWERERGGERERERSESGSVYVHVCVHTRESMGKARLEWLLEVGTFWCIHFSLVTEIYSANHSYLCASCRIWLGSITFLQGSCQWVTWPDLTITSWWYHYQGSACTTKQWAGTGTCTCTIMHVWYM